MTLALSWTLLMQAAHPEWQEALRGEVEREVESIRTHTTARGDAGGGGAEGGHDSPCGGHSFPTRRRPGRVGASSSRAPAGLKTKMKDERVGVFWTSLFSGPTCQVSLTVEIGRIVAHRSQKFI
jgi:hypothetical protein